MIYKETKSLFLRRYQYKVVLVTSAASYFRGGDIDNTLQELNEIDVNGNNIMHWRVRIKDPEITLSVCKALCNDLKKMTDLEIRVENPFLSIYTNNLKDVSTLEKHFEDHIKYISKPATPDSLSEDTIVMPKLTNYDFKVTVAATKADHASFINWASNNSKIRITKSCVRDLSRTRSWGGTHFYVVGEKNLLVAKMHLGGAIAKIQRIVKE